MSKFVNVENKLSIDDCNINLCTNFSKFLCNILFIKFLNKLFLILFIIFKCIYLYFSNYLKIDIYFSYH